MYPYHPTDFSFYPSLYLLYHYPLLFLDTRLPLLPNLSSLSSSLFSLYTSPCKQPRLTPTPFSILSFSFLLHSIAQSLFLSLSLTRRNFRFFRGQPSILPLPVHPHFFPLFTDRYIACRPVRRYHTVHPRNIHTPTLTTQSLPPTGDDNNENDLVLFHRVGIYCCQCVVFSFFFFWGPFLGTSIFDVYVFSSVVVSLWRDRQDHFRPHFFPIRRTSSEVLVFARIFLDSVFLVFRRYSRERGQNSNFSLTKELNNAGRTWKLLDRFRSG